MYRPYQSDALNAIKKDLSIQGASLVVMPTASGKSHVIAGTAQMMQPVLILQPSQELLAQNMAKLALLIPSEDIGVYSASFNRREIKRFTFATIQSVYTKPELFQHIKLVIIDESHNLAPRSLGTSVSPISGKVSRNVDPEMVEAAKVLHEVAPEFDDLKTFSQKLDATDAGIATLANQLRTNLAKQEIQPILTSLDVQALQKSMTQEILRNPLLVGDAGQIAERIFNQFKEFLPGLGKKDILMSDVLDARQQLDNWVRNLKGSTPFDPKTESALSVSLRAVRQGANNIMERKIPQANVKKLLRKQSLLYKAIDNLSKKASREVGSTRASRFMDRHQTAMGLLGTTAKWVAGATGVGTGTVLAEKFLRD